MKTHFDCLTVVCAFALTSTLATQAVAHDVDVWISASNGMLTTSGYDHETGRITYPGLRVFGADMGDDPMFPLAAFDPGFGSDLVGSSVQLLLAPGLGMWNGSGFDAAGPTTLSTAYGSSFADTAVGGSLEFLISEDFHVHPDYWLSDGAAPGIYLVALQLQGQGYQSSETFWCVFNLGMTEEDHTAAMEWVEANLVPGPGALWIITALAGSRTVAGRRRALR
ncbi:MAG: hypothetical protein U0636_11395 [Phycisphaerales bacterium]